MKKEDIKLLLEMKANCLKDYGTIIGTYSPTKSLLKANAISNAINEIERLNNIITELEKWLCEEYKELDRKGSTNYHYSMEEIRKVLVKLKELKEDSK